jgi:hypothetical protein
MLAVARQVDLASLPGAVARFAPLGQVFVTAGRRYEVFAVSVFEGQVAFQVVDDIEYPAWLPAVLFDLEDATLPSDWICNIFQQEPTLVLGPRFVANSLDVYRKMVELEADSVTQFWERVKAQTDRDLEAASS